MVDTPGLPDHAPAKAQTDGLSPKAILSGVAGAVVGVIVALLNGVQENPDLLGALPTWAQTLILLIVPPLISFFAAYRASPGAVYVKKG